MAKILVVDDNPEVVEMYGEALRAAGHDVDTATDGMDALNLCVYSRYALVVSDIYMPGINGVELMEMIRAQRPGMPYVYITSGAAPPESIKIWKADGLVRKVDGIAALISKIRDVLSLKGTDAGTSQTPDAIVQEDEGAASRHADRPAEETRALLQKLTAENAQLRHELKQTHEQNQSFAADLARTFSMERQKTRMLIRTQEQLVRSAKLATLGQMIAAIAHDVGNMIAPISGYADLLLTSPGLPEKAQKYAERIQQASGRTSNMLRSLMDFGSDRGGKRAPVQLETVVQAAVALLEYNLARKGVKIVIRLEPGLAVFANAGQIEQVLVNLMVNAMHAMESKGGGELLICAKRIAGKTEDAARAKGISAGGKAVDCVCLEVTDQGVGIPQAVMEHIFEPFFTTKEKGKGTGLGLFICYDIIEQHGGVLDVASTVGAGTTFTITLPTHDASKPPEPDGTSPT